MLKEKRKQIIDYVKSNAGLVNETKEIMNIFDGNLKTYVDFILKSSLSPNYYNAIKDRILPINILQRYVNKVSVVYLNPPVRTPEKEEYQEFVNYYTDTLSLDQSGIIADQYANMFKGYAWEPFIDKNGVPAIRELAFDKFLVMSDSSVNPEEETIFIKLMGQKTEDTDSMLLHVYTDTEFDAFYLNGADAPEYLVESEGVNPIGVIPFIYGKRQKNKLLPVLDSDMLSIAKAIPVMLSDAAGAQMFQCFTILFGVDVNVDNLTMSPNAFWSIKSDPSSDKTPQVGTIKPEADTQKVLDFVVSIFTIWLETKGVRVGSIGSVDAGSVASGISKIIDEADASKLIVTNQQWFKKDEKELWNKLAKIQDYWIKAKLVNPSILPRTPIGEFVVNVDFEKPTPIISRAEEIRNIKDELSLKTMTLEQAIKKLHPDYTEEQVEEVLDESDSLNDLINYTETKNGMDS